MNAVTSDQTARVSGGTMFSYGVGQMGAQVVRDTPAVLLPVFMTTLLGIPAWLSGFVVLGPKLWLIICDPLMGMLSDRNKQRHGRGPFLVAGAVLTALSFMFLFAFSGFSSPYVAAAVVGLLFLIASTAFSAFTVPYLAIASELSEDPHERTKILTARVIFASLGVILSVGLAQPFIAYLGGGAEAWRIMAMVLGGIALVCMLATPLGLRSKIKAGGGAAAPSAGSIAGLKAARQNKPYLIITTTHFIHSTAQACSYTVVAFLFIYVVGKITLLLPFIALMSIAAMLVQPVWLAISRRLGKRNAFILATVLWSAVMLSWLPVKPGTDVLTSLPFIGDVSTEDLLVLLRGIAIGLTNSGVILLTLSMLTDTINAGAEGGGGADEGLLSGVFSSIEKLAFAMGPLIAGLAMSFFGYQSSVSGVIAQTRETVEGIVLIYSALPSAMAMASLFIFVRYRLDPGHQPAAAAA